MLDFWGELPFSLGDFRESCRNNLTPRDFAVLEQVIDGKMGESCHPLLMTWCHIVSALRQEIARRRKRQYQHKAQEQHGDEYSPYPRIAELLNRADQTEDLYQAQMMIERVGWQYLDEMLTGHFFSLENILVYAIKLKILARLAAMTEARGEEELKQKKQAVLAVAGR